MPLPTVIFTIALISCAFGVAFLALLLTSKVTGLRHKKRKTFMQDCTEYLAFLFEDENLVNATEGACEMITDTPKAESDWNRFILTFSAQFPNVKDAFSDLAELGEVKVLSHDEASWLEASWDDGMTRIKIVEREDEYQKMQADLHAHLALQSELGALRSVAQSAPFLVWRETALGEVCWANRAYLDLAKQCDPDAKVAAWPPARIFDADRAKVDTTGTGDRVSLRVPKEQDVRWYCIERTVIDDDSLFTAVAADSAVRAEVALREFVQTLTKTFAHLKTGLAIFDKQRQLNLFNPALIDLFGLSPEFLTSRPTLQAVLNRLRESRMLPEPKDFKSWSQRFQDLENAATEGTYEETWSLSTGQTFRVIGRPHPDGAVAFLVEDITAEISMTRRYRAEQEVVQSVLDNMKEAIAVFSPNGDMMISNKRYKEFWGNDPTERLVGFGITDATKDWATQCAPTPVWGDVRDFVGAFGERSEWSAVVRANDGRQIQCNFLPMTGGNTLIEFAHETHAPAADRRVSVTQAQIPEAAIAN